MDKQQMIEYLRENLKIDIKTTSEYVGSCGDSMYKDFTVIQLKLGDEVISEVDL